MRGGANNHIIVKIVSGASTWLFSDVDMQLTDGAVYGLLIDGTTVDQSVDYRECMVNASEVELRFSNVKYNPYGTVPRLSELWASLGNDAVDIYLAAGPITAISDCMRIFAGRISGLPTFGELEVVINVKDTGSALLETMLPDTILSTIYPYPFIQNKDKYAPIIYGSFKFPGESFWDSYGTISDGNKSLIGTLAPTVLIQKYQAYNWWGDLDEIPKEADPAPRHRCFCVSDHPLFSQLGAWIFIDSIGGGVLCELRGGSDGLDVAGDLPQAFFFHNTPSPYRNTLYIRLPDHPYFDDRIDPSPTAAPDETGFKPNERVTAVVTSNDKPSIDYISKNWYLGTARAYIYPSDVSDTNDAINAMNACSDDPSYAIIEDVDEELNLLFDSNLGGSGNINMPRLNHTFGESYSYPDLLEPYNDKYESSVEVSNVLWAYVSARFSIAPGATHGGFFLLMAGSGKGTSGSTVTTPPSAINIFTPTTDSRGLIGSDDTNMYWLRGWGHDDSAINWSLLEGNPDAIEAIHVSLASAVSGVPSNGELVRVYALRLILEFDYTEIAVKQGKIFAECEGYKFDTWIDNESHSNSFDETDLIEHAPYIIESLLIDRLSVAEANIDQASFDRAYDSNVEARIALHTDERRTVREIFNELGLQSLFAVHYSAAGKWRLIPLYGASTAASAIIRWGNVEPDSFRISQGSLDDIVNSLAYKYCYRYDLDEAIWSGAASDSASITKYGTKKGDFTFRHIVEDSVAYVTNFLCGTGGYWSNPIKEISFYSPGFTYSQLDLGDIIDFDVEFDNHVLDGATSFSGEHFMIVGKNQTLEGLTIKVIPARMRA
jgi:hypothetical protein